MVSPLWYIMVARANAQSQRCEVQQVLDDLKVNKP